VGETDAQFVYNTRKKAWKVMKERFWKLPDNIQNELMNSLQSMFRDMFTWMNVGNTRELVLQHTVARKVPPRAPNALTGLLQYQ
jgi:hypothetical protein